MPPVIAWVLAGHIYLTYVMHIVRCVCTSYAYACAQTYVHMWVTLGLNLVLSTSTALSTIVQPHLKTLVMQRSLERCRFQKQVQFPTCR